MSVQVKCVRATVCGEGVLDVPEKEKRQTYLRGGLERGDQELGKVFDESARTRRAILAARGETGQGERAELK